MAQVAKRRKQRRPTKVYTTTQARESLPTLVKKAAGRKKAGRNLRSHAVVIQPRGAGGKALLIPEVDIEAAEREIAELYELIEDIELMHLMEARVAAGDEAARPLADVIRDLGHEDLLQDARTSDSRARRR